MKVIVILLIFLIGIIAGYTYYSGTSPTGMAIECSFRNQPCECDDQTCKCGNHTIMSEDCYSNNER